MLFHVLWGFNKYCKDENHTDEIDIRARSDLECGL